MIEVKVTGMDKINANLQKAIQKLGAGALKGVEAACILVEGKAKQNLTTNRSVVTGRLRASITYKVNTANYTGTVGTNVYYAPYVEFGTRRSRAKPYLAPALQRSRYEINSIFVRMLKGAIL